MSDRPCFIYALLDPRDASVRYIGKTIDPAVRLAIHLSEAQGSRGPGNTRCDWILELLALGLTPRITVLEETIESVSDERERAVVAAHLASGGSMLTNSLHMLRLGKAPDHVLARIRAGASRRSAAYRVRNG